MTHKGHLDVGLQGSFMLLDLLIKEDRPDLAALIMGQETYPGWGYLAQGTQSNDMAGDVVRMGKPDHPGRRNSRRMVLRGAGRHPSRSAAPGFKHFIIRPGDRRTTWTG